MARSTHSQFYFRFEDALFRFVIWGMRRLPYNARLRAMGWVFCHLVGRLAGYRTRALSNLQMVYPDWSDDKRAKIADRCLKNFGRTLIENYSRPEFRAHIKTHTPTGPGLAIAQQALAEGRSIIFSSGHHSNHEAARIALDELGFSVGGLYRPMRNPFVNKHYVDSIAEISGEVFAQGKDGTRAFLRYLKKGGHGFLLHDVHFPRGEVLPFLGHDAHTSFATADLAKRFDALVIPYFVTRLPNGRDFQIEFEAPVPHGDSREMMQDLVSRLERRIEKNPDQWYWFHRRWKA